jgi:hypothetical protein
MLGTMTRQRKAATDGCDQRSTEEPAGNHQIEFCPPNMITREQLKFYDTKPEKQGLEKDSEHYLAVYWNHIVLLPLQSTNFEMLHIILNCFLNYCIVKQKVLQKTLKQFSRHVYCVSY